MTLRSQLSLDGTWQFWTDPEVRLTPDTLRAAASTTVAVPAPWQSQSDDLRFYSGIAWYRRTVEIPIEWLDDRIILGFGAVDYHAEVWFNGTPVGSHEGGYLPFEFDVTELVRPGDNTLTVRVSDPDVLFPEIPHGKQSWYGPLSGIWQSVWLERRAPFHLRRLHVVPDLQTGRIRVHLLLAAEAEEGYRVSVAVVAPGGEIVTVEQVDVPAGQDSLEHTLSVAEPLPWSPDTPHLYRMEVSLHQGEERVDALAEHFGFRTIEARGGHLFLNGEMLYLLGALDQDYYPDTISTPPSLEFLEDQFRKAKELGLNCLRCHIKVPDPRYYEVADRVGMLIWTELPNWRSPTAKAAALARSTM
ncbi:MAG: beta galactosidase jelly roll domain-containing protein, partial [Chloroflexota bacterium]|nr:beta galactosidase jelly roll domain-containing protein [Chloroflexota bacterium]